jgi:hypothetical protein
MPVAKYFILGIVAFIGLLAVVIFVVNLVRPNRHPMESQKNWVAAILALAGISAFLSGMWLLVQGGDQQLGFKLAGGGMAAAAASIAINSVTARSRRNSWPTVQARCVERILQTQYDEGAMRWTWHLLCDFSFEGKAYHIAPKIGWSDIGQCQAYFSSEAKAKAYIDQMISGNGSCVIRINPQDPQDAELLPFSENVLR